MSKDPQKLAIERQQKQQTSFCWGHTKPVKLDNQAANRLQRGGY